MTYRAPVEDMLAALEHAGLGRVLEEDPSGGLAADDVAAVLAEAGRFAAGTIAPLDRVGDRESARLADGRVTMPAGFTDAYARWCDAGWGGIAAGERYGGQNLPVMVAGAVTEMWSSASLAFGIGPVLTAGAIDAIEAHADESLKARYLPRLISGEWTATMNLTEPQAGSDLGLLRTRAQPRSDGTYALTGTKIFITYGEHDLTENIVHLVLARLPDAPAGTRGISLFLVPKLLPGTGGPGRRNEVTCTGLEHKLGLHASPTCTMSFEGATGWLVGKPHDGLACMFTMMNKARLAVGIQGVAVAEHACQLAQAYARDRRQGRRPGMGPEETVAIAEHPDVRRMLLTMRALTQAARLVCYETACAIDGATRARDPASREAAAERAGLLTPLAKAFSTDIGVEVASLGVQVHGGMGYIEETGAAQLLRDARITPIYEGTNGIQAIDLVTRRLPRAGGAAVRDHIARLRATAQAASASNTPGLACTGAVLSRTVADLERATGWMIEAAGARPDEALAGASAYLRLMGVATGGAGLAGLALLPGTPHLQARRIALARFCAGYLLGASGGLADSIVEGAGSVLDADARAD